MRKHVQALRKFLREKIHDEIDFRTLEEELKWALAQCDHALAAKPRTITIHVRGGVAYPPERCPAGVRVRIIDHDNH